MRWELNIDLDRSLGAGKSSEQPVFLRLARAISDDVKRGRLRPGDALPGSRTLARALGVHRNTVLAAYAELVAEGWIASEPAAGTFVSRALPDVEPRRFARAAAPRRALPTKLGFDLAPRTMPGDRRELPADALIMSGGVPDVRLLATAPLARAYRRALRLHGNELLSYGDARGHVSLRTALPTMLSALPGLAT